ncbi:ATP-binding cassette domain-containing protein [Mediterraneibacter glycyrrhizinilyticus]|uniref:cell division ATP-binding protein FtsE n=1 Tax=Mediterraneibacter glycyrrhizinilyticus TaxID=342942 RepID=UPI001D07EF24|nr:ATP-binding cassette domain-containing protein [Mediterraneibacter glycyrrhizinilyticus]MCB6310263.1 ATP-binding cassette domain-containing protein [Lachnospiraceae bacterium 210521-DFI.1.109]MCB6427762.1 ATP-binding cassette domain-containing protein [Mediterraneibacter glycyrrhizinilyticus]
MGFDTADFLIGTIDEMPGKQYSVWRMNFCGSRRGKMAEIVFDHVTKVFQEQIALEDISFQIEKGEFVFVTGKSGAGKSTLLELLIKQQEPTAGNVFVFQKALGVLKEKEIPHYRRRLGIMSPEIGMLNNMTVYENVALALYAVEQGGKGMKRKIMRALGLVGIAEKAYAYPKELSGGEQARMLLARAMAVNPDVLIADEPTANLDPDAAWDMMLLFNEIHRQGKTLIIATHARELVTIMRKRVITLVAGALVADEKNAIYNQKAMDIFEERRVLQERENKLEKNINIY